MDLSIGLGVIADLFIILPKPTYTLYPIPSYTYLYVLIPTYTYLYRHGSWLLCRFDMQGFQVLTFGAAILALKTLELPFWRYSIASLFTLKPSKTNLLLVR